MSKTKTTTTTTDQLADDVLFGAAAIAAELGVPVRRAFLLLEGKHLPADKIAGRWTSTRTRLRKFFQGGAS